MNESLGENCVFIVGNIKELSVSHEFLGVTYVKLVVRVNRLTEGKYDDLPVIAPRWVASGLEVGMLIKVIGELRRYKNFNSNWQSRCMMVYTKNIIVSMEPACHQNTVRISGKINFINEIRVTPSTKRRITDFFVDVVQVNGNILKYDVFPCVAWNKQAYFMSKLERNVKVKVFGRLQTRDFEKVHEDGTVTLETVQEVSCNYIKVLD